MQSATLCEGSLRAPMLALVLIASGFTLYLSASLILPIVVARESASTAIDATMGTMVTILSTLMLLHFLLASGDLLFRELDAVTSEHEGTLRMVGTLRAFREDIGRCCAPITLVNRGLRTSTGPALWALAVTAVRICSERITALQRLAAILSRS